MEMWENQLSFLAPCQCLTLAGITTVTPSFNSTVGLPSSTYQPSPAIQIRICCPPAPSEVWICQQVRHPGSKVTLLMNSGISSFGNTIDDRNDTPVKYCEKVSFVWPAPNRLARSNSSRFRYFMTRLLRSVPLQTPCLAQAPPCRDTFLNCHAPPCISPASCGHPSPSRQAPRHGDCS